MKQAATRTAQQVREEFLRKGISIASWARKNGLSPATVSQVMTGKNDASRGQGHKIAVMLGLKDGEIIEGGDHE
ncbi:DNA-binding protein [Rhodocyclus purpureus]|uniref:DNA-binding protein n=1 Tax=Rhodocyclus purpureus TaxID=1067 RepID=UPI0019116EBB|nr:DNA-binding protein [Rhodocyclus purpureus]MBK5915349.1 hypothetical protein [Rhodocyclus purpureus]